MLLFCISNQIYSREFYITVTKLTSCKMALFGSQRCGTTHTHRVTENATQPREFIRSKCISVSFFACKRAKKSRTTGLIIWIWCWSIESGFPTMSCQTQATSFIFIQIAFFFSCSVESNFKSVHLVRICSYRFFVVAKKEEEKPLQ